MKIVLIMPHGDIHRKGGIFQKALRYAPLTLTTLAAEVPQELNAEIQLIDEGVEDLHVNQIEADLVGITCITGTSYRAYAIADELRQRGVTVVLGGVHPTLMPDEAQQHADAIVTGYAEEAWPQLLRDFARGMMQPRYNQARDMRLQSVPEPRRDLLDSSKYVTMNTVQAVRGCPWRCNFCVVPVAWPMYLHRPIPEVIREIERLDGKEFLFLDLSPIEDPVYIKQLYRELIPLRKRWGGLATMAITRDDEMLSLAAKSGCRGLLLGIESISEESIRRMGKKKLNNITDYYEGIKKLHDHGIAIYGCFVFGLDGDDKSVFERTVEFVDRAAIDLPRFAVATPFPNTRLYHQLKSEGRLLHEDWRYYDVQHVVFRPELMSPERLEEGLHWTWEQAYRLPSIIRRLSQSAAARTSLITRLLPANLAYRYFARLLPEFAMTSCEQPLVDRPKANDQVCS